jgi:two-component system OmpR family response regulator
VASALEASTDSSAQTQVRVLVVDDEPSIVDTVATVFRYEGYQVAEAHDGREALMRLQEERYDLAVLDVMMPGIDGLEVTRRIRSDGVDIPILFLTAKGETGDLVAGLAAGGDDYIAKPFSLAELVARAKALLRRTGRAAEDRRLRFADLSLDEDSHEVWRGETQVQLTATEFNLLRAFMLNPRRVLSKSQLIDYVWHYDFGGNQNIVETYVRYLRRKLDPLGPPLIHTIRLVGYVLREPDA